MTDLAVRQAVEDAVVRMFVATDERDWTALEDCFTNPITLDMTSLAGGAPADMAPGEVAAAWAEGFKTLDHVHHQVGNFRTDVQRNRAVVRCYGVAFHHRAAAAGIKSRIFVGTYELALQAFPDKWRISRLTFKLKFIDGNLNLEQGG